jgi:single-stranded DNA-binding protein
MAIEAKITGNLLVNPSSKVVKTGRGEIRIAEFRMMSDVWKQAKEGDVNAEPVQDESKTHPVQVTIWNERLAEAVVNTMRAGMRVCVTGDMYQSKNTATDEERSAGKRDYSDLRCDGSNVYLMLNRVDSVTMRQRTPAEAVPA